MTSLTLHYVTSNVTQNTRPSLTRRWVEASAILIIGESLSEPHTSESNSGIFIYIYRQAESTFINTLMMLDCLWNGYM